MKTSREFGYAYAEWGHTEREDGPVDVNAMLGGSVDIPEGDYRAMRNEGIEPDARQYWEGYNSYFASLGASMMGRKGGKSKSDAKARTARENGRRGGRPRFIRTLRELIDEHDANGVVMIDAGNGSAGPRWVPLEGIDEDMLSVSMGRHMSAPANRDARSATGDDKYIVRWASDWIEDDDRGGDFEVQNPWRYRLLF